MSQINPWNLASVEAEEMSARVDQLMTDLALPTSITQMQYALAEVAHQLGFEHYLLIVVAGRHPRLINLLHNFPRQVPANELAQGDWLARVQNDPLPEVFFPGAWPVWLRHGLAASAIDPRSGAATLRPTLILERANSVFEDPAAQALVGNAQRAIVSCSAGLRIANVLDRPPQQELSCLKMACEGMTHKQIGHALGISDRTAETYLKRSRKRLGVASTTQACVAAMDRGWFGEQDAEMLGEYVSRRVAAMGSRYPRYASK